jgi:serine/threonine-protein kinase SRPK3
MSNKKITVIDELDNTLPVSSETESDNEEDEYGAPIIEEVVYPGLLLKDEYILLKKIGFGNNATVWMTYCISKKNFIAMKIQDDQCYDDGCREVMIIKKINAFAKTNPTQCVVMHDYFIYQFDDQRKYICSIYDLYAGSIQMVLNKGKYKYGLPIPTVKTIIKQLLSALVVLHDKLNIIHTDIKPENILFKGTPDYHVDVIKLFAESMFQQKYDQLVLKYKKDPNTKLSEADAILFTEELENLALESVREICMVHENVCEQSEELIPDDEDSDEFIEGEDDDDEEEEEEEEDDEFSNSVNTRKQSVEDKLDYLDYSIQHDLDEEAYYNFDDVLNHRDTTSDPNPVINDMYVTNCETALTDFGNSYLHAKRTRHEIQDRRYRAPEIILDLNYTYSCDIWSVGCVLFELLTGYVLFEPEDRPLTKDIHHLYLLEKMLGPMPLKMKQKSKRCRFLFNPKKAYTIRNVKKFKSAPIKERLVKQFLFSESDAAEIDEFLKCMLQYDHTQRKRAVDLLNHPWLNK